MLCVLLHEKYLNEQKFAMRSGVKMASFLWKVKEFDKKKEEWSQYV